MKSSFAAFLFLLAIGYAHSFAQTKTNLELINSLVDRTVIKTEHLLTAGSPVSLSVVTTQSLEIMKPRILSEFNRRGFGIFTDGEVPNVTLAYTLISAGIEYKSSFSDGIFGSILVERSIHVNSSVIISKSGQMSPPV
ncbi:MAG: hypothetical protein WC061_09045, partial [Melioribacteraceae bacterium]